MNGSHEMLRQSLLSLSLAALCVACHGKSEDKIAETAARPLAELSVAFQTEHASIREAQHLVRTNPKAAASYVKLARSFVEAKRESGDPVLLAYAEDALAAAETLAPRSTEVLTVRGVLLQEDHKFEELAELAAAMIKADSGDSTGYLLLGDARLEVGDYDGATAAYEEAMERYPDLRVYSRGAHLRWLSGDIDGALEFLDAALESAGRNREHLAFCLTDVGTLFLHRGEFERALAAADRADQMVPGYAAAAALRARAELGEKRYDDAWAAIGAALATRKSAADYFLLAEIEEARGNAPQALAAATAGLKLAGHDPVPAATYLARHGKDTERAVALATKESQARPTVGALAATALALHRIGDEDAASAAIERALRLGTPLAELHLSAGLIELARGDAAGARLALGRADALNPNADPLLADELRAGLEKVR